MIERIDERRRIFHVDGRAIYALREGDVAVTYEPHFMASLVMRTASVNFHAKTKLTGGMSQSEHQESCEFLDDECVCWFDGTSLAKVHDNDDDIWTMLETELQSLTGGRNA